jgi:hypothetical protein
MITGFEHAGATQPDITSFVGLFLPWRSWHRAVTVRYESLVRSPETRQDALRRVIRFLAEGQLDPVVEAGALDAAERAFDPSASRTFRRGQIGDWEEEFDGLTRRMFDAVAGGLVEEMGYTP